MPIVTRYGNAVKDPAALLAVSALDAEGQVRSAYSKVAPNLDSATSLHLLARLPSNCRLLPNSTVYFSALTGLTSYDIGLGVNGAVLVGRANALVAAESFVAAGNVSMVKAVAVGSLGKRLWELAGYTADPGGMIDIIGTVNVATSTVGTIESFANFSKG